MVSHEFNDIVVGLKVGIELAAPLGIRRGTGTDRGTGPVVPAVAVFRQIAAQVAAIPVENEEYRKFVDTTALDAKEGEPLRRLKSAEIAIVLRLCECHMIALK